MTDAQAAQQHNRHSDGRYAEKSLDDPGQSLLAGAEPEWVALRDAATYDIPTWGRKAALAKIDKANKRLARAGIEQRFEPIWAEPRNVTRTRPDGSEVIYEVQTLTLNHPVLAYEGWEFVASLDDTGNGMIVRSRPGAELNGWRPEAQRCDHCGKFRARTETYVVRNVETGELLQVGSSCMQNFLGIRPNGLWAIGFDPLAEDEQEDADDLFVSWGGASKRDEMHSTRQVIAAALILTRDGREYRPADFEASTSSAVKDVLWGYGGTSEEQQARARLRQQVAELAASPKVDEVLAAVAAMKAGTDYADNMRMLAGAEAVGYRHAGLMASAVKVWAKQQESQAVEKATPPKEGFLAEVGTQLKTLRTRDGRAGVAVTVNKVFYGSYFDPFGYERPNTTLIMRTEDGQTLRWRASTGLDLNFGDQMLLTGGSVKGHSQYDGHDQTDLQRVKFEVVSNPDANEVTK